MSTDVSGAELSVGDMVAYCSVGYSDLTVGRIVKITPQGATVTSGKHKISRRSYQLCKVTGGHDKL